jgi:hypothetical protein
VGGPQFTYEDAAGSRQFKGNEEIHELDTEFGRLVTVKTDQVEGTAALGTTLTVLIPRFKFQGKGNEVPFTTWAITTTPHDQKLGEAALQTYRVDQLTGIATKAYF